MKVEANVNANRLKKLQKLLEWICDCEYSNQLTTVEMGGECLLRVNLLMLERARGAPQSRQSSRLSLQSSELAPACTRKQVPPPPPLGEGAGEATPLFTSVFVFLRC